MGSNKRIIKCFRLEGELWRAASPTPPQSRTHFKVKLCSPELYLIRKFKGGWARKYSTLQLPHTRNELQNSLVHTLVHTLNIYLTSQVQCINPLYKGNFSYINHFSINPIAWTIIAKIKLHPTALPWYKARDETIKIVKTVSIRLYMWPFHQGKVSAFMVVANILR